MKTASLPAWRAWLLAARPATLPAAVVPVLVGAAVALNAGVFRALPFWATLLAATLIQIGTNFANDYFDFHKGADTAERLGPVRVTQSGLIAIGTVRSGMLLIFGLAALVGLYLVAVGGWPILLIGVLSIAAGVLYTGGPWPLGYHGLGDLFVFVFFGLVAVMGTTFVQMGAVPLAALVNALPIAMLATALLVVNNLRDIHTDRAAHKYTLAVLLGARVARAEYLLLLLLAYLLPLLNWWLGAAPLWFWLPWLSAPLAVRLLRIMLYQDGAALNPALKGTGLLQLLFGLLLSASLLL